MCNYPARSSDCFASRQLTSHEGIIPHDLELAIVVFTMKIWRYCFLKQRVEIYTYHKSLKSMFTQMELNMRQYKCLKLVTDYDMKIQYQPVKANEVPDALSRKLTATYLT